MKNKFEFYTPLMHKKEYKFLEKYLDENDELLEWGSGASTIYFSGLVKHVNSIEHDVDFYLPLMKNIKSFDIKNIDLHIVNGTNVTDSKKERYIQFKEYIEYPITKKMTFTKILIDGRARKHCANFIYDYIDENVIVFIHDFNFNDVEGYVDETYFDDILSKYNIFDREFTGQGIVALKKKIIKL
jgi:hypothetical protein